MKKIVFLILLMIGLVSCKDNKTDFDYNQKITKEFIANRDNVNKLHQDIVDGAYNHISDPSKHFSTQSVIKNVQTAEKSIGVVNKAEHSVAADALHTEVLDYLNHLNNVYYPKAKEFIEAEDGEPKQIGFQELGVIKSELDQKEQQVLDAKTLFLKQVNIEE